jgi:D-aminopeptidase
MARGTLPATVFALALAVLPAAAPAASPCGEGGAPPPAPEPRPRPRLRDLGASPGILPPGPLNAITDVAGVAVGHRTLREGEAVRTGVTAILPHGGNLFQRKVPAAVHVANGFGKAAGFLQVAELGTLETPIVLTNTLAVGTAVEAVVDWTFEQAGNEEVRSVNAVVGETNDGWLNDIRRRAVTAAHVRQAIAAARTGPVAEGGVGAGTGTMALGWKGGIGTASRRLPEAMGGWTVGALVQTNFGGILRIDGVPVGELLGRHAYRDELRAAAATRGDSADAEGVSPAPGDGSVMVVLATDAPLSALQLERLARRAVPALGRVGSFISNGSGDFVVAFSTANPRPHAGGPQVLSFEEVANDALSPLFLAAVESVEEAIYNSLFAATPVTGRDGHAAEALPVDAVRELLRRHGRLE